MSTEHDQAAAAAQPDPADPAAGDASHAAPDTYPAARIAQLNAERDDMRDRWMRSEAEIAERPRPRQARRGRHAAVCGAEIRAPTWSRRRRTSGAA